MSLVNRRMLVLGFALMLPLAGAVHASKPELKRRGMMGVQLGDVNDEVKTKLKLEDASGAYVSGIVPDGAAAAAGMKADDIIKKIGDNAIANRPALFDVMRNYGAGDTVPLTVLREGKEVKVDLVLKPRPGETWDDCELMYETAGEAGKLIRVLITKPKTGEGKRPAVVMVMGPSRQQSEFSFPGPHPFKSLISELSKAGYVTVRVDRPGVGDSEGKFDDLTPAIESAAIQSALKQLTSYDFIDAKNIFIFSHSMGSSAIPAAVKGVPVRGVITYAAITRPWPESVTDTLERQWKLELISDDQIKTRTESWKGFVEKFVDKNQSPADILKDNPQLREVLGDSLEGGSVLGMSTNYARESAKAKPTATWSDVKVPVLAIWGEADFVANRKDSEMIAEMVNKAAPGKGKFVAQPKTDHQLGKAEDQEEAFLAGNSPFQPTIIETLTKWMTEQSKGA